MRKHKFKGFNVVTMPKVRRQGDIMLFNNKLMNLNTGKVISDKHRGKR